MGGLIFYVNISGLRKGANNHEEIWLSQNKYKRAAFRQRYQVLMKALYLGTFQIAKKWTMPIRNWGKVRGELEIMVPDRMLI